MTRFFAIQVDYTCAATQYFLAVYLNNSPLHSTFRSEKKNSSADTKAKIFHSDTDESIPGREGSLPLLPMKFLYFNLDGISLAGSLAEECHKKGNIG